MTLTVWSVIKSRTRKDDRTTKLTNDCKLTIKTKKTKRTDR